MEQEKFEQALQTWLEGAQAIIERYFDSHFPNNGRPKLEAVRGKRFVKIVAVDRSSRSAHTFIDLSNGDVLKPASWKVPARHARGNIFDESNGLAKMLWTGPAYLR